MDPTQGSRLALPTYFPTVLTRETHPVECTTVAMAAMAEGVAEEMVEVEVVVDNDNNKGHDASMSV